ncbi:hypothetical protein ACIBFB_21585 [Nocardiopsis sp. NPDC050513]|uniref:hypothetical protein n=1 Tax=Nocardiopsis sp. NPDC050513 TaxID=3364338 RepID=UPI0037BBA989
MATDTTQAPAPRTAPDNGLLIAVEEIAALRSRGDQPSDGGGTGRSDTNDGFH